MVHITIDVRSDCFWIRTSKLGIFEDIIDFIQVQMLVGFLPNFDLYKYQPSYKFSSDFYVLYSTWYIVVRRLTGIRWCRKPFSIILKVGDWFSWKLTQKYICDVKNRKARSREPRWTEDILLTTWYKIRGQMRSVNVLAQRSLGYEYIQAFFANGPGLTEYSVTKGDPLDWV